MNVNSTLRYSLAALVTTAVLAAVAVHHLNGATHRPVHFKLKDRWCRELRQAQGAKPAHAVPCTMTAYLAHSDIGWVGYGYSDNVTGQCLLLPYDTIDRGSFDIDTAAPALDALPVSCSTQWAPFHPHMGL
ncbi:hypothetical protein RHOFW510R12_00440 [Rhodanobacter sp. FW510-R12]